MKDLTNLVEKSRDFATSLIVGHLSGNYYYHNLRHTQEVVEQAHFLCDKENIDSRNRQLIEIAAWFHDTGFIKDYLKHEVESAKIARESLEQQSLDESDIEFVVDCIMATELHTEKKNIFCKILSDADCFHFGLPRFIARSICLKHEWETVRNVELSLKQILAGSIMFLEQHEFYTNYGINILEEGKQQNLQYMIHLEEFLEENNY